jgi:hypothetical protein
LLLCFRATRPFAWISGLLFVVTMEVACAMPLFARTDVIRKAILPVTILLAALVLMRAGLLPGFLFH